MIASGLPRTYIQSLTMKLRKLQAQEVILSRLRASVMMLFSVTYMLHNVITYMNYCICISGVISCRWVAYIIEKHCKSVYKWLRIIIYITFYINRSWYTKFIIPNIYKWPKFCGIFNNNLLDWSYIWRLITLRNLLNSVSNEWNFNFLRLVRRSFFFLIFLIIFELNERFLNISWNTSTKYFIYWKV